MASVSEQSSGPWGTGLSTDDPRIGSARLVAISLIGPGAALALWALHSQGARIFVPFVAAYLVLLVLALPRKLLTPLSFVHIYYGVWYVIAPLFAQRYSGPAMDAPAINLALAYLFTGYVTCVLGCVWAEWAVGDHAAAGVAAQASSREPASLLAPIVLLYVLSTMMVALIVESSGGWSVWLANPGDAFLNRQGSGPFVILSHFCSMLLAALCGLQAHRRQRLMWLLVFVGWLLLTSPVHGSKFQMILLLVLALLPWLRQVSPLSGKSLLLGVSFVAIFVLGLYFRNLDWIETNTFLPYALNYFTTLDNFAMSLKDMPPGALETFFMPFRKLASPVGIPDTSFYFDMNHLLTDMYFPHAWAIRATEQWPVEKDLYLNFGFVGGLPLLFGYLFAVTALCQWATRRDTLGLWFASATITLLLVSHLRGSLYNFNDFYMYPFLAGACFLLRNVPMRRPAPAQASHADTPTPTAG